MKLRKYLSFIPIGAFALMMASCAYDEIDNNTSHEGEMLINLSGEINQVMTTRANDSGFVDGDMIGVYIVDYQGENAGTLLNSGNHADNVTFTFDESGNKWISSRDIYWTDNHTPIDVYGYYPTGAPENVNSYSFSVLTDQNKVYDDGSMGGYESSDFLWGKVTGVSPTANAIRLPLSHKMANARVTLVEGDGFDNGEWAETSKQVLVTNTIQSAVIDLSTGTVTPNGEVGSKAIIPYSDSGEWRAIVVPQTISSGTQLFSITINGVPYSFSKDEAVVYPSGKMSNFAIKVDKKNGSGQYSLTLIGESITAWENDNISHDGTARQYVVVDVAEPGTLEQCINNQGLDIASIYNLKITGKINNYDFAVIRYLMSNLTSLNLKEVKIVAGTSGEYTFGETSISLEESKEDYIPASALSYNSTLVNLVFPDILKGIGDYAFSSCSLLSGSLTLPEGLEIIGSYAFAYCSGLTGNLSLPSTLKEIGSYAFGECAFISELNLPESLQHIRIAAFAFNSGFYGELKFPDSLQTLEGGAFSNCKNLTGSLEIPQFITEVPGSCFSECGFNGVLYLHNGINIIGESAFRNCNFKGELNLPSTVVEIGPNAFKGNSFSGDLTIPESLSSLGEAAFANNTRLSGILEFNDNLNYIDKEAFSGCTGIQGLIFSESIENIGNSAFDGCSGIGSIVCKGENPPHLYADVFNGVPKDNFALEVPESAVTQYGITSGWLDFKRIVAHHELVCRPAVACAISSEHKQTLVIDAEGEWEVESKPAWCQLSQTSGNNKTELTLTIQAGVANGDSREGDIVFRLKDNDYTHQCHVTQYGYEHGEDEYLTLQKATKGNNGGINIVIIGDGYDAKDIASGTYLTDMKQQIEYFFAIEPYTTYRDYFNVYTAFPLSTESGVGTLNTIKYNRFETTFTSDSGLKCDTDEVFSYVLNAPTVNSGNLDQTLIILVPNSTDYGGVTQMWESGAAIAICPKSTYAYPNDSRGVIQYHAGGEGFGKLANESIIYNDFAPGLVLSEILYAQNLGWYDNIDITGKMHQVAWSHLIFDERYSDIVDIYEGAYEYARGVFRSEQTSCMNNNIPYYSTISRQSIVKRIKQYAGEAFSFEEFVEKDNRDIGVSTRSMNQYGGKSTHYTNLPPQILKGSPLKSLQKSKK